MLKIRFYIDPEPDLTEQRIIITNDKDFGEQVFRDQQQHGGVLLLCLADDRTIIRKPV